MTSASQSWKPKSNVCARTQLFERLQARARWPGFDRLSCHLIGCNFVDYSQVSLRIQTSQLREIDPVLHARTDVELTLRVPNEGSGLIAQPLLPDELIMFYDAQKRSAPSTLNDCLSSRHAFVQFDIDPMAGRFDRALHQAAKRRQIAYKGPSYSALGAVLRGS